MRKAYRPGVLLGLLIPVIIWAANATLPFTFNSGGTIRASEMNANFSALQNAFNAGGSGTRLKLITMKSADGLSIQLPALQAPVWDSQLGISCYIAYGYCVPQYHVGSNYSDPACTVKVADVGPVQNVAYILSTFGFDAGINASDTPRFAYGWVAGNVTFYRLGPAQTGTWYETYFTSLPDGGQISNCVSAGSRTFATIAGVEPASTFARVDMTVQ